MNCRRAVGCVILSRKRLRKRAPSRLRACVCVRSLVIRYAIYVLRPADEVKRAQQWLGTNCSGKNGRDPVVVLIITLNVY